MKGCLIRILVLPVFLGVGILSFALWIGGPLTDTMIRSSPAAGIIAGLLFWFIWLSLLDIRKYKKYLSELNNTNFQEGEPVVVSGKIITHKDLLTAPFSGEPCIGYYYKVSHLSRKGSTPTDCTDYEGYALIPCVIRSPLGEFKILADSNEDFFYEIKEDIYRDSLERTQEFSEILQRAQHYINTTEFTEKKEEKGSFKVDKKIGNTENLENCTLHEKLIKAEDICLLAGICTFTPFGIRPDSDSIMEPFRIIPNGENGLKKKIRDRWTAVFVSVLLTGITAVAEYFVVIKK